MNSNDDKSAFGFDSPNRGPLDVTVNSTTGGSGGAMGGGSMGSDNPNRGPLDRTANAVTGGTGGVSGAVGGGMGHQSGGMGSGAMGQESGGIASAMFDSQDEAQRAVEELRQMGVSNSDLSLVAQKGRTTTTREGGGEITDEEHGNILRGILGGGALGAGLGVAALAIPGVGPLAALGAIAASAVPEAMAIGAAAGAAAGTLNETLKKHGVSDEDASYYSDHLKSGGVLVTVHTNTIGREQAQDVLYRNGGHSAARARAGAL